MINLIINIILTIILAIGTLTDLKNREIPDILPVIIFIMGIIKIVAGYMDFKIALAGLIIPLALFSIIEMTSKENIIGGGDYKIFMTIGFCIGCPNILVSMFFTFLLAMIFAKIRKSESLPICPFALIGTLLTFV